MCFLAIYEIFGMLNNLYLRRTIN